jgi:2-polyprenyl-3-methyl-5-hydroxy-6-metoxy-1,4-benzoquinol methylase
VKKRYAVSKHNFSRYTLETGVRDIKRLSILNKLYNPISKKFMLESGLTTGMTVAEIGCGSGILTCWLAKKVSPHGVVFAIDADIKQLAVAQLLAEKQGINNIIFKHMCLKDLVKFANKFDFIYSRWVLMYLKEPHVGVENMIIALKKRGILICEDVDFSNVSVFSFPRTHVLLQWMHYWTKNFEILELKKIDFFNDVYLTMKKLKLKHFKLKTNQPILSTSHEKSVLRLGMEATRSSILKNKAATEDEYQEFLDAAENFEQADSVIGFVRNILVSAKK